MTAYPLSEVLSSVLTALSAAQRESDLFSQSLYQESGDAGSDILPVPWAQLSTVGLTLRFAVDSVQPSEGGGHSGAPEMMVLVTAADLEPLPPKDVSTLEIQINVSDQEYLKTDGPSDPLMPDR